MPDTSPVRRLTFGKRLAFATLPLLLLLVLAEVAVRVTGAATHCPNPYYDSALWACDPVLSFKLQPTLIVDGQALNAAGFRAPEFTKKRASVFRILSLGDSCTFGIATTSNWFAYIHEPYPQKLEHLIAERVGPGEAEVINAGIPGYTSSHGTMLLRSKLRGLKPDLITVRYGWNDHFVSHGGVNAFRETDSAVGRAVEDVLLHTALYPFVLRLGFEFRAWRGSGGGKPLAATIPTTWEPTVSIEQYKRNLRRIVELGRAEGARVWLLTSPHAFVTNENSGREAGPNAWTAETVLKFNAIPTFSRLEEIHEMYNQASREIGAELSVPVVDMDAIYRAHANEHLFTSTDVAHPTQEGHDLEAETLYAELVAEGVMHPARPASKLHVTDSPE